MRLSDAAHRSQPWRIHDVAPDFELVDVWALPTPGGPDDFPRLVRIAGELDPGHSTSPLVRALFALRWKLGELLRWDGPDSGLGARVASLRERLPPDLLDGPPAMGSAALPFLPVYVTSDELAWELANKTLHGVLHLGWVPDGRGGWRGQMAVLVKHNGLLGHLYLAAIAPFRHLVVYPLMLRDFEQAWTAGDGTS